ncbi:MAG: HIT family hydrolase [Phycisphaerae bacterium]|nr:HIT family hydrolase [Phycisphaerae bacterium]
MTDAPRNAKTPQDDGGESTPAAIWAPWRLAYLESTVEADPTPAAPSSPPPPTSDAPPPSASFLRQYWLSPAEDEPNHVLIRDEHGMIMLNRYPYANGHLLVALGDARPRLLDYEPEQRAALWALVDRAANLLEKTLRPQGVNIGVNQGRAAGAGVPQHLHAHLVPRWGGDVNFITTVGQIRVIPSALDAMADRFKATLAKHPEI